MRLSKLLVIALLPWALAQTVVAAVPENLKSSFTVEARLLDREIDEYARAWGRQREAVNRLRSITDRLDAALSDPNSSVSSLRSMESEFGVALDSAYARARETGEVRKRLYQRMNRLAELAREIERQAGNQLLDIDTPLNGMWKIEAQPIDVHGLMNLRQEGTLVTGTYRLSNGNQGSVQGTFAGGNLRLELVEVEAGHVGTIRGELDTDAGEVRGDWQAMDLTGGRPSAGSWSAHKVSADEEIDF
jgi:hypothetical protein